MTVETSERKESLNRAVKFVIYTHGKVLVEKKFYPGKSYDLSITLPGGKVEKGESFIEALNREMEEECGIVSKKVFFLDLFEDITPSGIHYLVSANLISEFDGRLQNKEPQKSEHLWVYINEANKVLKYASAKYVLLLAQIRLIKEGLLEG